METDFTEQARDAVCQLFGEAAIQLLAAEQPVTNESMAKMIRQLSDGDPDSAEEFALQILK
ncbi:hypothetical protein ACMGGR_12765 [Erwinia sp. BNK-24-b]|uniref:hypothetical protein n=1 Tax=unclassified Erwinia TaxID=2622719 RepID=UPI0039BFBDB4